MEATQKEYVHIAGDKVSAGSEFMTAGALARPKLEYRGRYSHGAQGYTHKEVHCEVYAADDVLMVHTLCVRCGKPQRITSDRKKISWDKERGLFIEPFECTWELDDVGGVGQDRRVNFGLSLCNTRVAYDGKTVKDA